ncbi:MAG: flagellar filament capping protein FliD, partial [Armatimonadota bacterium]
MPGTASIGGVISNLNTDDIITKLINLERAPVTRLQARKAALNEKLAAWQETNTRLLALKTKLDGLAVSSTFQAKSFESSDESYIRGTATYSAQEGTYYVRVNALARAHQLASQGFADMDSESVGTGSVTITVGDGEPVVIDIDETNNTLAGLRDAINRSGAGVKATIINDGTGATPYRLLLTSSTSGTAGQISVESDLAGGSTPVFVTVQAAQDASVTLGEGEGAITVTRSTNQITDLIPGVSLNLIRADETRTLTLTIRPDTETIKSAIREFVEQYNNLIDYINDQFRYDPETKTAGTLFGDTSLQLILADLNAKVFAPVAGLDQSANSLLQIGISAGTTDNKISVDETKLDEALTENPDVLRRLFAAVGECSSSYVTYLGSTGKTVASDP